MRLTLVRTALLAGPLLCGLAACSKSPTAEIATSEISELPQSPPAAGTPGLSCRFDGSSYEHAHEACFKHPDGIGQYLICENGVWRRSRYCELP